LDPPGLGGSTDGNITLQEWEKMDQILRDVRLAIREFVRFLQMTCGDNFAAIAWRNFDVDKSGSVDEKEWGEAIQRFGFFGPSRPIFRYLDRDDEGTISIEEFRELEMYVMEDGTDTAEGLLERLDSSKPLSP